MVFWVESEKGVEEKNSFDKKGVKRKSLAVRE
jgi:hypothetical protein